MKEQFLVIIRGAPASGKTTIAKKLRNFDKKIVWLKVDNFKDFFSDDASLDEQKFVDESSLATLEYLLDNGFSVVMEKIFYDPFIIPLAIKSAEKRGVKSTVFQIQCSLPVLLKRDKSRPGVKEGCRKLLGDEVITRIYNQLTKTKVPGSIALDTEKLTIDQCLEVVNKYINSYNVPG